jgi:hypothetical protein
MNIRTWMLLTAILLIIALLVGSWILAGSNSFVNGEDRIVVAPSTESFRVSTESDSSLIRQYLATQDYKLDGIAATKNGFHAVIARREAVQLRQLFPLRVRNGSVELLHDPIPLSGIGPSSVEWVEVSGQSVDGLIITFNYSEVAEVGTVVFSLREPGLVQTYVDENPTCRPAELRDLNNNGQLELLTYMEDPSGGDCATECHLALQATFGVAPAWVEVRRWTGSEWEIASHRYPSFYRDMAKKYTEIDRWLQSAAGEPCRNVYWMPDRSPFERWAQSAVVLGSTPR